MITYVSNMPNQFVVPQFIEAEDRIIGPVTTRQFLILLVTSLTIAVFYKLLPFLYFVIVGILLLMVGLIFAFIRVNGMPFHFFLLNLVQTTKKARVRVWDKTPTERDLLYYTKAEEKADEKAPIQKRHYKKSHLRELSLVVDTGGVYRPEGEDEKSY